MLKDLPVALRKKRHLSRIVAVGRSSTSSSGSFLERLSQRLSQWTVSAMLEEAPGIARGHGLKRPTHRFYERLAGACPCLP